jgi:hypothetical protein
MRFAMDLPVKYTDNENRAPLASARTVNISSNGVLIAVDRKLARGAKLSLAIDWPVSLNWEHPVTLRAEGTIVRTDPGRAAIQIHDCHLTAAVNSRAA